MPWFADLSAEDRSWVGLIVQAGISGFVDWYRERPDSRQPPAPLAAAVFGAAPRALAGRHHPPADRRPGPAQHRGRRDQHRRHRRPRRRPRGARRACSATPARSPSPPPRSTPAPPRCAAPGTPASRRSSSTRCSAPRPTRPCSRGPARWAGARHGDVAVVLGPAPGDRRTETDLFDEVRRVGARPPAWTPCAPSRATGWSWCSAGSSDADKAGARGRRPLRRRARSWSARSPPTSRQAHVSARAALSAHRAAAGWPEAPAAGRAATTCCPSGRWPATATPAATWSTRSTCRWSAAAGTLLETLAAYFEHGGSIEAHRPGALRAPQHRALPAAPGRRPHRPRPRPTPRDAFTLRIALVLGRQSRSRPRRHVFVGTLQRSRPRVSCGAGRASTGPRPGRVEPCSSSSLPARAPRPPASSRPGWRTRRSPPGSTGSPTVAGLDLAHYGTEADADTIRDTADRPAAAGRHRPGRRPRRSSRTPPTRSADRRGRRPQRRRARRRRRRPASITAEQAMVLVRERGKAMADGRRRDPDRHDRRPRRRPRRGARRDRASTASPPPTTTAPARSSPPAPMRAARRASPTTRRPRRG